MVDTAWAAQREADSNSGTGFAVSTHGGDCLTASSASAAGFRAVGDTLLSDVLSRYLKVTTAVAVYPDDKGWPLRMHLEKLEKIAPDVDFLILDASNGHSTRWSLKQLLACDRTV
ncbi:MAG TPA: hypothetical protein V6C81_21065 [Planktothrix sp.]|jgi:hypothetical protein